MPGKQNASAQKGKDAKARPDDSDSGSPAEDFSGDLELHHDGIDGSDDGGSGSSEGEEELRGAGDSGSDDDGEGDSDGDEDVDLDLLPDEFGEEEDDDDDDDGRDVDGDGRDSSGDLMEDGEDDDGGDDGNTEDADADDEDGDGGRQEARRRSGSQAGTAAAKGGDGEGGGGGFLQGAKGASFAKAFNKLLTAKTKAAAEGEAPILAASKSVAKRQAEEDADAVARREAKKARLERRQRGHVKVPRKGEDPAHDQMEKQLGRLATKGVVMLFNAIANAQKQSKAAAAGAGAAAAKPAKLSKASFLAQLRASTAAEGGASGGGVLAAAAAAKGGDAGAAASAAPGWKVLQAGFSGLSGGGTKMKEWDRKPTGSDEEDARNMGMGGARSGSSSESEGDEDGGW